MPTTDSAPECRTTNSDCPSLALTTVVPTASSVKHRSPSFVPNVTNTVNEGQSISLPSQPAIGWLETIGKCYKTANISESTRNILPAARRKNTTSAYASAWNKWVSWCDPPSPRYIFTWDVSKVLEFMKSLGSNENLNLN